jgi:hypothetical protein
MHIPILLRETVDNLVNLNEMEVKLPPFDVNFSDTRSLALIKDWGYSYVNPEQFHNQGYKGKGTVVFVIDTMDTTDHPDLQANIIKESCISYVAEPAGDQNGHGTWCASRIALIAPETMIVGVKVLAGNGSGSSTNVAKGYTYAADAVLPAPYNTWRRITSASLGSSQPMPDVEAAIKYATSKGVLHIAAAGNAGYQTGQNTIGYPARYDDYVLAVAAIDSGEARATFSSVGDQNDVTAPGVNLDGAWKNQGFAKLSGTSMATPHISGATALLLGKYPNILLQAEFEAFLQKNAKDLLTAGWDMFTGAGSIIMTRFTDTPNPTPNPVCTALFKFDRLLYGAQDKASLLVELDVTDRPAFNQAMDILQKDLKVRLSRFLIINDTTESYITYLTKVKQELGTSYTIKSVQLETNNKLFKL